MNNAAIVGGKYVWDTNVILPAKASNRDLSGIIMTASLGAEGIGPSQWSYRDTGDDRFVETTDLRTIR